MADDRLPDLVEWLEDLGVEFRVEELANEQPPVRVVLFECRREALRPYVAELVQRCGRDLGNWLRARDRIRREVCVGGPLDGTRHHRTPGEHVFEHDRRASWHVYVVARDRSAPYFGKATSRKKAVELANRGRLQLFKPE